MLLSKGEETKARNLRAEGLARARAHTELGLVKIAREQPEEALREFLRVVVLYEPTDSGEGAGVWGLASLSAARAAARLGRREEAKRLLMVLLAQKRCSETPAFTEGKRMLADLEMR